MIAFLPRRCRRKEAPPFASAWSDYRAAVGTGRFGTPPKRSGMAPPRRSTPRWQPLRQRSLSSPGAQCGLRDPAAGAARRKYRFPVHWRPRPRMIEERLADPSELSCRSPQRLAIARIREPANFSGLQHLSSFLDRGLLPQRVQSLAPTKWPSGPRKKQRNIDTPFPRSAAGARAAMPPARKHAQAACCSICSGCFCSPPIWIWRGRIASGISRTKSMVSSPFTRSAFATLT
jgi:hypothetical protein